MHTYNTYLDIFKKGEFQLIHNFDAVVVFVMKFSTLFRLALAILCISLTYVLNDFSISEQLKVDLFIVASARASVLAKQPPSAVASGWLVWCGLYYSVQWGCYFYCTTMAEISKILSKNYYSFSSYKPTKI